MKRKEKCCNKYKLVFLHELVLLERNDNKHEYISKNL